MKRLLDKLSASPSKQRAPSPDPDATKEPFPDGPLMLKDCPDANLDICFVHGLTGNRSSTWTADGHTEPWPKTLLSSEFPSARIFTWGYDAYVVRATVVSSNGLKEHATNLLADITDIRVSCPSRPLIFVAHSLGGLVCKRAVLLSQTHAESHLRTLFSALKGIVFMGTPHQGSWIADWSNIPAHALGIFKSTNKSLLRVLQTADEFLESIQSDFLNMVRYLPEHEARHLRLTCFYEELPLPIVGKVVSQTSATLVGYNLRSIHANHKDMVKFASAEDTGFKRVLAELQRWDANISLNSVEFPDGSPSTSARNTTEGHQVDTSCTGSFTDLARGSRANDNVDNIINERMVEEATPFDLIRKVSELFDLPDDNLTYDCIARTLNALDVEARIQTLLRYKVIKLQIEALEANELKTTKMKLSLEKKKLDLEHKEAELEQEIKDKYSSATKRCLRSLSYSEMKYREAAIDQPMKNTCDWIYRNGIFRCWEAEPNRLLWIKGKPGSGKSVLMKSLYAHRKLAASSNRLLLEFFFNARGAVMERTPAGLYSTLLYSLVQQNPVCMFELIPRFLEKEAHTAISNLKWHVEELAEILHSKIAQKQKYEVEILIDALDECYEDEVRKVVRRFEDTIETAHSLGARLRICWSSRYYPNISMTSQHGAELKLDNNNYNDIRTYVNRELPMRSDHALFSIRKDLRSRARNVFLWAILATRRLHKAIDEGSDLKALEKLLHSLPQELDDMFDQIFVQIKATVEDQQELNRLAQWLLCSIRPMSLLELYTAWQIQASELPFTLQDLDLSRDGLIRFQKRINYVSRGLFETTEAELIVTPWPELTGLVGGASSSGNRVQVIHESVREYFLESKGLRLLSSPTTESFLESAHQEISLTCSKVFLATEFWPSPGPVGLGIVPSVEEFIESLVQWPSPSSLSSFVCKFWVDFMIEHFESVRNRFTVECIERHSLLGPRHFRRYAFRNYLRVYLFDGIQRVFPSSTLGSVLKDVSSNPSTFGYDAEELKRFTLFYHQFCATMYLFHRMGINKIVEINNTESDRAKPEFPVIAAFSVYEGNYDEKQEVEDCGLYLAGQIAQPPLNPKVDIVFLIAFTISCTSGNDFNWRRCHPDGKFANVKQFHIISDVDKLRWSDRLRKRWEDLPCQQGDATPYFSRSYLLFSTNPRQDNAQEKESTDAYDSALTQEIDELDPLKLVDAEPSWGPYWWSQWIPMGEASLNP